jgi:hypothetical protein
MREMPVVRELRLIAVALALVARVVQVVSVADWF